MIKYIFEKKSKDRRGVEDVIAFSSVSIPFSTQKWDVKLLTCQKEVSVFYRYLIRP